MAYVRPPLVISSPSRSGVRSPSRSSIRSPIRSSGPSQPQFELPSLSPPRSPTRTGVRSPTRTGVRSPTRSSVRSPPRAQSPPRSPSRAIKSGSFAERSQSSRKITYLYPTEAAIESNIPLQPRQEKIYQYIKKIIPQIEFERLGSGYGDVMDYSRFLARQRDALSGVNPKFITMMEQLMLYNSDEMLMAFKPTESTRSHKLKQIYGFYFSSSGALTFLLD